MSGDIIDNRHIRLADRLRNLLAEGARSAKFAVGYLFFDGLAPMCAEIERLPEVEILIGNVINRLTEEQVQEEAALHSRGGEEWVRMQGDVAATLRAEHDRVAAETVLNLRQTLISLPRTQEMRALLLTLAGRVADGGMKVRLYTQGRIHAKLTLIGYPPSHVYHTGIAIVGSSNVTLGGEAHPTELNVVMRDPLAVSELVGWYQNLWEVSQDFHRELFDELTQSWALQAAHA